MEGAPALSLLQMETALQAQSLLQTASHSKVPATEGTSRAVSAQQQGLWEVAGTSTPRVAVLLGISLCVPLVLFVVLACAGISLCVPPDKTQEPRLRVPSALASDSDMSNDAMEPPTPTKVLFYVIGNIAAGASLTIINSVTLNRFTPPAALAQRDNATYLFTLTTLQFVFVAGFAWLLGKTGQADVTPLKMKKIVTFFPAAAMLMILVVAGNSVMHYASVNTRLMLSAIVPFPCSLMEIWVYGDPCPPFMAWAGLAIALGGATAYAIVTDGLAFESVTWSIMFSVLMPVSALVKKHCYAYANLSQWGLVYYNSFLAGLISLVFAALFEVTSPAGLAGCLSSLAEPMTCFSVIAACVVAILLNFFQLTTIHYISATAKSVLGVASAFGALLLNIIFLQQTQGALGSMSVVVSLAGAVLWQQSVDAVCARQRTKTSQMGQTTFVLTTLAGLVWMGIVTHEANQQGVSSLQLA